MSMSVLFHGEAQRLAGGKIIKRDGMIEMVQSAKVILKIGKRRRVARKQRVERKMRIILHDQV